MAGNGYLQRFFKDIQRITFDPDKKLFGSSKKLL